MSRADSEYTEANIFGVIDERGYRAGKATTA